MNNYTFKLKNDKYDKGMVTPDMWAYEPLPFYNNIGRSVKPSARLLTKFNYVQERTVHF